MTQKERMNAGLIYNPLDKEITNDQNSALKLMYEFNLSRPDEIEKRAELLKKMLGSMGEDCYIEPPLRANWGGRHLHLGNNVYINFNLTAVDDADIYIGDKTMIGPNVTIATANHPIASKLRELGLQYNKGVNIGRNVWISAGVIIVPGVTIGDNSVIGAGSVVTKDIPTNVVAMGNPCRVKREIGEHDMIYLYKNEKIDWNNLNV